MSRKGFLTGVMSLAMLCCLCGCVHYKKVEKVEAKSDREQQIENSRSRVIPAYIIAKEPDYSLCTPRQDDKNGYLEKVCRFIVKNRINVDPAQPNRYQIKEIIEQPDSINLVLDCCYTGDHAVIDKKSGQVVSVTPGAM